MNLQEFNVFAEACPSRKSFEAIFSRWGILVLGALAKESMRFGTLRKTIQGISEKMLAHTLNVLEEERLVIRTEWNEKPPRVEYRLSEAGVKISAGVTEVIRDLYAALETRAQSFPGLDDRP